MLNKYTLIQDQEIIDRVYDFYVGKLLEPVPTVSVDALNGAVDEQLRRDPKIREMALTLFYDDRFVREAEVLAKELYR